MGSSGPQANFENCFAEWDPLDPVCPQRNFFEVCPQRVKPGSVGLVAGWGKTENGDYPNYLLSVAVLTIPKSQCDDSYYAIGGLPQGQICAGYPDGRYDACNGDGGSPLVINDRLVDYPGV
ncbi:trypsin-1-like [Cotesia glomerata]|uniref:trypsin-1-like n=1 Tax=Cotesia glomerata TaxID=32391 RepID=UPI001D01D80A|nr:trypsin-1-like [Cotesia glomerata]